MTVGCTSRFEEGLLSGLIDGELTQQDEQRTRLHLQECAPCRALVEELRALREVSMSTRFPEPTDEQWQEAARTPGSRFARRIGWLLVLAWCAAVAGFATWQLATGPEQPLEKLLAFGGALGLGLLLLSVLLDRIKTARTDRYRGVQR